MKTDYKALVNFGQKMLKKPLTVWKKSGFSSMSRKVVRRLWFYAHKPAVIRQPLFTDEELEEQKHHVFSRDITFSIIVPLYNTPEQFLREMIESVQAQTYGKWELCLADGSTTEFSNVEVICRSYAAEDPRIRYRKLEKNLGISGNTNACLEMAAGEYLALFDHDDILHPAALYEMMQAVCTQNADYVFTDEVVFVGKLSNVYAVHCKPEYSRDSLLASNYVCHFSAFSRELLEKTGTFQSQYDGSQDHDFMLRAMKNAQKVVHIPKILYYWRSHPNSVASDIDSKSYAVDAGIRAVQDNLTAEGIDACVESSPQLPAVYRVRYALKAKPLVSVILTGSAEQIGKCVQALKATAYENLEIVAVTDAQLPGVQTVPVEEGTDPRNTGANYAKGEQLVFLSDRVTRVVPEWLEELLMYAQRADIGAVGGRVLDENGRICHSGLYLDYNGSAVGDPYAGEPADSIGLMGCLCYQSPQIGVSPDCLMVSKADFLKVGGFESAFDGNLSGADLCLRLLDAGLTTLWTPYAEVTVSHSREKNDPEQEKMFRQKWAVWFRKGDPYHSPQRRSLLKDLNPFQ